MPMYNLLEYNKNYSNTSGSVWNYYRDELTGETNNDNGPNKNLINSKSFKYKTSITEVLIMWRLLLETMMQIKKAQKKVCAIKTFKQFLENALINCEVSLALSWSENFVITSLEKRLVTAEQGDNPTVYDDSPTNATFKITDCKLYIPVVTVSAENDNKLLDQLKTGFKGTIKWNKY